MDVEVRKDFPPALQSLSADVFFVFWPETLQIKVQPSLRESTSFAVFNRDDELHHGKHRGSSS